MKVSTKLLDKIPMQYTTEACDLLTDLPDDINTTIKTTYYTATVEGFINIILTHKLTNISTFVWKDLTLARWIVNRYFLDKNINIGYFEGFSDLSKGKIIIVLETLPKIFYTQLKHEFFKNTWEISYLQLMITYDMSLETADMTSIVCF